MRKNILLFFHSYNPPFIDVCNQYTALFDKSQYETTVVFLAGEPNEQVKQHMLAENIIFLNSSKKSIRGLKIAAIKKMLVLCREKKFEIVICHRYKTIYIMLWVALFYKIPALFFVMHELDTLKHVSRKLLIAFLARKNMIFAGVSNAVRNNMRGDIWRVPSERVITLYNMINIETEQEVLDRNSARKELGISQDAFVFGNLGRLVKNKDQKTLIEAFALMKPQCPNAQLVVMGTGILEAELKQQTQELKISKEVIFSGFVAHGFRLMKAFDVYVSSSTQEAFCRVLLEAMIARVPIIATCAHGVPEVIGDAGKLIESKNPEMLGAAMLKAYASADKQLVLWGEMGYQRAIQHFSLQHFNELFWMEYARWFQKK